METLLFKPKLISMTHQPLVPHTLKELDTWLPLPTHPQLLFKRQVTSLDSSDNQTRQCQDNWPHTTGEVPIQPLLHALLVSTHQTQMTPVSPPPIRRSLSLPRLLLGKAIFTSTRSQVLQTLLQVLLHGKVPEPSLSHPPLLLLLLPPSTDDNSFTS